MFLFEFVLKRSSHDKNESNDWMDRISNYDTNKFVYLIVHLINFLTKINIILKTKTKINNFVQKNVAYTKKKKNSV